MKEKKEYNKQLRLTKNKWWKWVKQAYIFVLNLDTRVKCMFIAFFSLRSLFKLSALFSVVAGKNQINFFFLAWKFELYNYRKPSKKLVRNRKKVMLLKAENVVLRTGKKLPSIFFYRIFRKFQVKIKRWKKEYNR